MKNLSVSHTIYIGFFSDFFKYLNKNHTNVVVKQIAKNIFTGFYIDVKALRIL